jgi:CheY-like chemotaxis protein
VAVTANAMEGDCERLLAEGMDDYQSKLYGLEHLRAILGMRLEQSPAG